MSAGGRAQKNSQVVYFSEFFQKWWVLANLGVNYKSVGNFWHGTIRTFNLRQVVPGMCVCGCLTFHDLEYSVWPIQMTC